ncbi:MAG: aldo/keto reductase [Vicinamibacteria bacterium]|nr:aldo/keto reductase [Vicinamibacteria bacterium]
MHSLMDELSVGPIIYGCMRIGGAWSPEPPSQDERASAFRALDTALECGARLFDHADIYTCGRSETLFGEWLRSRAIPRDRVLIQSKCGIRPGEGDAPDRYDFSREHILGSVEGILARLGVDDLDVLMLHRPDPLGEPEEVADAVAELKRRGWIRAFGVSNFSAAQIRLYAKFLDEPIRVNQVELSLRHPALIESAVQINRAAQGAGAGVDDLLDFCRESDVDIQAWSPLAKGQTGPEVLATTLAEVASRHGVAPETGQIAWILRHPAKIRPVIGSTRPERIREAFAAANVTLSREDWYRLLNAARGRDLP